MKRPTERELLQKQWDVWCDEQFVYMKKWAIRIATEILFDHRALTNPNYEKKLQSIIMKSMLKRQKQCEK